MKDLIFEDLLNLVHLHLKAFVTCAFVRSIQIFTNSMIKVAYLAFHTFINI